MDDIRYIELFTVTSYYHKRVTEHVLLVCVYLKIMLHIPFVSCFKTTILIFIKFNINKNFNCKLNCFLS